MDKQTNKMDYLKEDFKKWAVKNSIEQNVNFTPEQMAAYKNGKTIRIFDNNDQLEIRRNGNDFAVKLIRDFHSMKDRLTNDDLNELLNGNKVNKVNSFVGEVTSQTDTHITLSNPEHGDFQIEKKFNENYELGKTLEATLKIETKEDNKGNTYNTEYYDLESANANSKVEYSSLEMDDYMQVHEINPHDVVKNIQRINSTPLTKKQKLDLIQGKTIDLDDDNTLEVAPKSKFGIRAKKVLLVATVFIDGGTTFLIYNAMRLAKKRRLKEAQKELDLMNKYIKKEQQNNPNNPSLKKEIEKFQTYMKAEELKNTETETLNIDIKEINDKGEIISEKTITSNMEELHKDLNTSLKESPEQMVHYSIKSASNKTLANVTFAKNDLLIKDKELFESYMNTKHLLLFENKNNNLEDLHLKIEKVKQITEKEDFVKSIEQRRTNNFENYLKALKSVAQQKARAYPENARIRNDVNILSKNINMINTSGFKKTNVKQHKKAHATGVNDPDLFQDSLTAKEQRKRKETEQKVRQQRSMRRTL